ncbi:MAG: hypothetical protein K0R50_893 [Eubacterium sp.]|jgi:hypothetical protein|nr:hypothetical protein [Eubacterium sp.]
MQGDEYVSSIVKTPHIFGVRHLSPGASYHLLQFLDEIKPTAVLVEGLSDANSQIGYFTSGGTRLPIAILAYTEELPVRTILYPFADYSPEYQALLWAKKNGAHAEFIDLPSEVFIPLDYDVTAGEEPDRDAGSEQNKIVRQSIYDQWAKQAGEDDHNSYWEYNFEHNLNRDSYRLAAYEFGKSLRELRSDNKYEHAKNLVREAYMRNRIRKTIDAGHSADRIVVVTGAYHASVLNLDFEPMSDEELENLPRVRTKLTLMPYSYYRLSSRSGYGAGNEAPSYFGLMWQALVKKDLEKLPAEYLSRVAAYLRASGTPCSSAEVIEGVRLANTLAALHSGSAPANRDLKDAAVVCLGRGELSVVAEAIANTDIGTAIGSLPEGVSRTSIQDDFYRELKGLKLEKYKSVVSMDLDLDLRENRRVKSEEAAFLDLNRSYFLNRLKNLNISFQKMKANAQDKATWAEAWVLKWSPEAEIELVESTLLGETIELAAAYKFKERLEKSNSIAEAAKVIKAACECGMMESMEQARTALQRLAVDSSSFNEIAGAAFDLSIVISYGDIRKFNTELLIPLLQQLFLRGTLLMPEAARCDNNASKAIFESINRMNTIALEHFAYIEEELWVSKLMELSDADDRNPLLSGYACSILLERNLIDGEKLSQEVSRRLSPGIDADLGAGWFEGLSMRNRYALLARMSLWEQLAGYVNSLEDAQFKRALVFLRRAFGDFGPAEKRSICETLGEIWGTGREETSDYLSREMSREEQENLEELDNFDFGDI